MPVAPYVLVGAIGAGKTTIFNALHGQQVQAVKTQAVDYEIDGSIDTPGEFFSHPRLYHALINTTTDANILVYVHAANDSQCRLPAGILEVYGKRRIFTVITKTDLPDADVPATRELLRAHGFTGPIFEVSPDNPEGLAALQAALSPEAAPGG